MTAGAAMLGLTLSAGCDQPQPDYGVPDTADTGGGNRTMGCPILAKRVEERTRARATSMGCQIPVCTQLMTAMGTLRQMATVMMQMRAGTLVRKRLPVMAWTRTVTGMTTRDAQLLF